MFNTVPLYDERYKTKQLADHGDTGLYYRNKKKKVAQMINDGAVRKIKSIQLNMKMGKGIISFPII